MKLAKTLFIIGAATLLTAPAAAGVIFGSLFGNDRGHGHPGSSSSGGMPSSSGGMPSSSSSGGATSVPEPGDAVLLLMGAAGVIIGRKLHARAKRRD